MDFSFLVVMITKTILCSTVVAGLRRVYGCEEQRRNDAVSESLGDRGLPERETAPDGWCFFEGDTSLWKNCFTDGRLLS